MLSSDFLFVTNYRKILTFIFVTITFDFGMFQEFEILTDPVIMWTNEGFEYFEMERTPPLIVTNNRETVCESVCKAKTFFFDDTNYTTRLGDHPLLEDHFPEKITSDKHLFIVNVEDINSRQEFLAQVLLCRCSDRNPKAGFYLLTADKFHSYIVMTAHPSRKSVIMRGIVMDFLVLTPTEDAFTEFRELYAHSARQGLYQEISSSSSSLQQSTFQFKLRQFRVCVSHHRRKNSNRFYDHSIQLQFSLRNYSYLLETMRTITERVARKQLKLYLWVWTCAIGIGQTTVAYDIWDYPEESEMKVFVLNYDHRSGSTQIDLYHWIPNPIQLKK